MRGLGIVYKGGMMIVLLLLFCEDDIELIVCVIGCQQEYLNSDCL